MEEEMEDQRRLMDFTRIPRIILHRIDVCKEEEVLNEPSNQEENATLYQGGPDLLQIKQEQEEAELLQIKQEQEEAELLQIKQEQEGPEHQQFKDEEKQLCISQDEERLPYNVQRIHNETEPQRNQLISHDSAEDENQDQEGIPQFT
ncbi:UPF0746 protein DDB_G0281095-like [Xiphophorus couchianus]|uniref:UPF0746 protein DDB_G0281095-like n=1 Tax=Xiphophorus couchianus TaxID=32473 RepID=UPI001016726B|nr:UPF0746 protein DDB_G0281095-like [Xiphophorus couchianus]